jgi:pteridine reductase
VELRGRTALVTGGAVRVGRALALALAGEGMRVAIHFGGSATEADEVVRRIRGGGREAVALQADLADAAAVERLADEAEGAWPGGVDVLVNSAAVFPSEDIEATDAALWDRTLAVNLRAPFLLIRRLAPRMRGRGDGTVVNIADLAGLQTWRHFAAHGIAKAGLVHLTQTAAREFAPEVRVVGIAPGTVLPPVGTPDDELRRLAERAPLRRIGSPDDVVGAMLYLLRAPFVTGQTLVVDGGRLIAS